MPERPAAHQEPPLAVDLGLPPGLGGTVLTVGTFDGVHRGHRLVLARLHARAKETGLASVLVTFSPHPLEIVNPAAAPLLLTAGEEKNEVLVESRIDYAVVLPFTPSLAAYSAEQFVSEVMLRRLGMRELLVGYDHGFGRGREGDVDVLKSLGVAHGFRVEVVPPVPGRDGRPISSTSIRRSVAGGDLARAADGLGRPYSVSGVVERGAARGRLLGFPTLNVTLPAARKLLPPEGVYAVRVETASGAFGGMLNLGPRPTFGESAVTLEAHLFDAEGDWYGSRVRVDFIARLRDTKKFDGPEALMKQLGRDEQMARVVIGRVRAGI
jgi:riboflavin kinase / FMN adenylyltransferase